MQSPGKAFLSAASLLSALVAALAALSCAGPAPSSRRGDTESPAASKPSVSSSSTGAGSPAEQTGGHFELAGKLSSLRRATPRARSQHLTGDLEAEVLANERASAYPSLGPDRPLTAGATLVEVHFAPGSSDPSVLFAMIKHPPGFDPEGGDWEYLIAEPSGAIVRRGKLALCARCHAEAPHNYIFGGPR